MHKLNQLRKEHHHYYFRSELCQIRNDLNAITRATAPLKKSISWRAYTFCLQLPTESPNHGHVRRQPYTLASRGQSNVDVRLTRTVPLYYRYFHTSKMLLPREEGKPKWSHTGPIWSHQYAQLYTWDFGPFL